MLKFFVCFFGPWVQDPHCLWRVLSVLFSSKFALKMSAFDRGWPKHNHNQTHAVFLDCISPFIFRKAFLVFFFHRGSQQKLGSVLAERIFSRIFIFEPPDVFADFVAGFSPHFYGKKCPENSSRKIPGKILQNLYNKNPRQLSAEGPGQQKIWLIVLGRSFLLTARSFLLTVGLCWLR